MTTVVISQPMLFPWPGFFEQFALADSYIHLDDAQFSKGSFTNRIQVKLADGRRWMTIPLSGKGSFQRIADLSAIDAAWKQAHRDLLRQSLRGAPFLADALSIMDEAYGNQQVCDILKASIELPAAYMGLGSTLKICDSSSLGVEGQSSQRVLNLVKAVGGTRYVTGHGAANYLDHEAFETVGIGVDYMDYSLTSWPQGTGSFTPYVTILDLIAHTGAQARTYLRPGTISWQSFLRHRQR